MGNRESLDFGDPKQLLAFYSHLEHEAGHLEGILEGIIELTPDELKIGEEEVKRKKLDAKESYLYEKLFTLRNNLNLICDYFKREGKTQEELAKQVLELKHKVELWFAHRFVHTDVTREEVAKRIENVREKYAGTLERGKIQKSGKKRGDK